MTLVSAGLGSGFTAFFTGLTTLFGSALASDFLFVTEAFNFSESGFAADMDLPAVLAIGLEAAFAVTLSRVLGTSFVNVLPDDAPFAIRVLVLPLDLAALALTAGFPAVLEGAALTAACFGFFTEDGWGFAGFFIAFAMGSIPNGYSLLQGKICQKKINQLNFNDLAFKFATIGNLFLLKKLFNQKLL